MVPSTLQPILRLIGQDAVPFVLDQVRAIETFLDGLPADTTVLPRVVGMHHTALRGVTFERITTPYTLWMLRRVQSTFQALPVAGQMAVRELLADTGCAPLLDYTPRHRVERRPFQLHLVR